MNLSQCETGPFSQTFAVILVSSRSFWRWASSSLVFRSVQTRDRKAMRFESANHSGALTPVGQSVSRRASPPSVGIRYSWFCLSSPRFETNAIHLPSGL
jgi:hypothetical protein